MNRLEFIKLWNTAQDLKEVAERAGAKPESCSIRAVRLRQQGVKMLHFDRGVKRTQGGDHGDRRYKRWSRLTST